MVKQNIINETISALNGDNWEEAKYLYNLAIESKDNNLINMLDRLWERI